MIQLIEQRTNEEYKLKLQRELEFLNKKKRVEKITQSTQTDVISDNQQQIENTKQTETQNKKIQPQPQPTLMFKYQENLIIKFDRGVQTLPEEKNEDFWKKQISTLEKKMAYFRDAFQELKIQHDLQLKEQEAKLKFQYQNELKENIRLIEEQMKDKILFADREVNQVQQLLTQKDIQMSKLTRLLAEQELNIQFNYSSEESINFKKANNINQELLNAKQEEINNMGQQIFVLQQMLCKQQDENEEKTSQLSQQIIKYNKFALSNEKKIKKILQQHQKDLEEWENKYIELKQAFNEYIDNVQREAKLKDIIQQKHIQTIDQLKDEIKTAKQIITTPRLKSLVLSKLKDYEPFLKPQIPNQNQPQSNFQRKQFDTNHRNRTISPVPNFQNQILNQTQERTWNASTDLALKNDKVFEEGQSIICKKIPKIHKIDLPGNISS